MDIIALIAGCFCVTAAAWPQLKTGVLMTFGLFITGMAFLIIFAQYHEGIIYYKGQNAALMAVTGFLVFSAGFVMKMREAKWHIPKRHADWIEGQSR